jgi:hypothetical protein
MGLFLESAIVTGGDLLPNSLRNPAVEPAPLLGELANVAFLN